MKIECSVARDLMPLCIEGVASAESIQYTEDHMAKCSECKNYYMEMQDAFPKRAAAAEAKDRAAFEKAAEIMRLKHRMRVWRNVLIGILIGVIAVVGLYTGWQELVTKYNGEIPTDDYGISLAQLKDGRVVVSVDYRHSKRIVGLSIKKQFMTASADAEKNPYILRIYLSTTLIPQTMATESRNGPAATLPDIDSVDSIVIGRREEQILWQHGDDIPQASEEMEAYFQADEALTSYWLELNEKYYAKDTGWDGTEEEQRMRAALLEKREELRLNVPEWQ